MKEGARIILSYYGLSFISVYLCSSVAKLSSVGDASGNDRCHGCAEEGAPVERGIARLACALFRAERPFVVRGENGEVARLIFRDAPFDAQDARGAQRKQF